MMDCKADMEVVLTYIANVCNVNIDELFINIHKIPSECAYVNT